MNRNCPICGNDSDSAFHAKILKKYDIEYFRCPKCEAIFTQEPVWLNEAYSEALTCMDTGVMARNILYCQEVTDILAEAFGMLPSDKTGEMKGLDYAGGYGIMTRMLRDRGYDFEWYDKYAVNDLAKGYEYVSGNVDIVTAFEVFEHLDAPNKDIAWIAARHPKAVIFSTLVYPGDKIPERNWWYWCFEHGQHIMFYSNNTLKYIAEKYDWNYYSISNELHIFTSKSVDINNGIKKLNRVKKKRHIISLFGALLRIKEFGGASLTQHDFLEQRERINA